MFSLFAFVFGCCLLRCCGNLLAGFMGFAVWKLCGLTGFMFGSWWFLYCCDGCWLMFCCVVYLGFGWFRRCVVYWFRFAVALRLLVDSLCCGLVTVLCLECWCCIVIVGICVSFTWFRGL